MGIRQFFSRKPDVMPSGDDVLRIGNTFYGSRGTYHADGAEGMYILAGDILYGPNGKGWTPVRACDVIGIIETCQDF